MEFDTFVRKPFTVEAIEVTSDNLEEVAEMIGTVRTEQNTNRRYIEVNKNKIPNVGRVYPGYFLTRMGKARMRVYSYKIFKEQFVENSTEVQTWANSLETTNA